MYRPNKMNMMLRTTDILALLKARVVPSIERGEGDVNQRNGANNEIDFTEGR
jgi:hypothetical protein